MSTPKKTTVKKAPKATTVDRAEDGGIVLRKKEKGEVATTLLFTGIEEDGTEIEFRIDNRARPNIAFGYMRRLRSVGPEAAQAYMLEQMLGDDALAYLERQEDLTEEENEAIMDRVKTIAMGGAQAPKA